MMYFKVTHIILFKIFTLWVIEIKVTVTIRITDCILFRLRHKRAYLLSEQHGLKIVKFLGLLGI